MALTAAQAAGMAEHYYKALNAQVAIYERWFPRGVVPFIKAHVGAALGKGNMVSTETQLLLRRLKPQDHANVQFAGQDAATMALWAQHKVVYHLDHDLWEELGDADDDTFIPAGIFKYLPHPDPFLAFPEPLYLPINETLYQRADGFFVTGRAPGTDGSFQRSTANPDVQELGLLIVGPLYNADGRPHMLPGGVHDMIFTRATMPGNGATVADMRKTVGTKFLSLAEDTGWHEHLPMMLKRAAAMLIYLCATNADLTPLPAPPPKKKGVGKGEKRIRTVGVGYKVGAALRAYKKNNHASSKGAGKTKAPHIRRAHFHTYRCGPGRAESRVKWLPPIPVNATTQEAEVPTVIGVSE